MTKSNENSTTTSPGSGSGLDPGTKKPVRERPPLLKRSKTSISNDTHFPGPLFPAVRRVSSASHPPRLPDLRVSVDDNVSNYTSPTVSHSMSSNDNYLSFNTDVSTNSSDGNSSFSDRDWMYPSFLGPHVARNRVTVKGRRGGGGGGGRGGVVEGGVVQGSDKKVVVEETEKNEGLSRSGGGRRSSGVRVEVKKESEEGKLTEAKEGKTAAAEEAVQVSVAQSSSVTRGGGARRSSLQGLTSSWFLYLVCSCYLLYCLLHY